jgi:hypothetical protein
MGKCRIWTVTTNQACKLSVKMGRTLSFIVMAEGDQSKARVARSCEYSATYAWNLNLNNGNANNNTKATNQNRVRAVSAPLQIASTLRKIKGYGYYGRIVRSVF